MTPQIAPAVVRRTGAVTVCHVLPLATTWFRKISSFRRHVRASATRSPRAGAWKLTWIPTVDAL